MEQMESKRFDLEQEMFDSVWFRNKVRESKSYAQNLYAAMCNNEFVKNDVWPILQDKRWSASWRGAGGIVADLRGEGDYMDWYCSGMGFFDKSELVPLNYVPEGMVTDEIREDLLKLGWITKQDDK
jgi:hypothetical protein